MSDLSQNIYIVQQKWLLFQAIDEEHSKIISLNAAWHLIFSIIKQSVAY